MHVLSRANGVLSTEMHGKCQIGSAYVELLVQQPSDLAALHQASFREP